MRYERPRSTRGFTLVELLAVITVIGILIAFILIAAADGVRRAEEKATLALITKLEVGLSDRMEAILVKRADVYPAHILLAGITPAGNTFPNGFIRSNQREQVLAQFDLVRSEMPDVFVPQITAAGLPSDGHYPFNFGAQSPLAIPGLTTFPPGAPATGDWSMPLGSFNAGTINNQATIYSYLNVQAPPALPMTGVYGASWGAMAGIHKNIGYLAAGYDGVDNNGNGLVDDWSEGVTATNSAKVTQNILNHKHNTARSEMLYALLVEGQGPLGSVFAADEFTAREVADTDNDGLPEFIDAWRQPLQFFRWPIFYNPDSNPATSIVTGASINTTVTVNPANYIQKGLQPYSTVIEPRQLDPLDPGQQLMSPSWFDGTVNQTLGQGSGNVSASVLAFESFFHYMRDPSYGSGVVWDRSGAYPRRSYYSRPLILSSGPDKLLGVANFGGPTNVGANIAIIPGVSPIAAILQIESPANPFWCYPPVPVIPAQTGSVLIPPSPNVNLTVMNLGDDPTATDPKVYPGTNGPNVALITNAVDDISNLSLSSATAGGR